MKNVLLGQVPGSDKFGPAPVETKRPIDQPPFPGGGAQADSGAPSGGGGAKVGDKNTIVETDLGTGPQVETKVDTKTKGEGGADEFKDKYENKTQPGDDTPADPPTETPSAPNYLMIAGGLALLYFLFKRKRK